MIINSYLDTDSYTFSVGRAVLERFPNTAVTFRFTNRTPHKTFSQECFDAIKKEIWHLGDISLTNEEIEWMTENLPFLTEEYLCWVKNMQLNPVEEIDIKLTDDGQLELDIIGDWARVIFYEVPILAIISECYFKHMDTDWNYDGQEEQHLKKAGRLSFLKCVFADFGTRRRRSLKSQELVVNTMKGTKGFVGTSNVYLAKKYGIKAIGTQSHQWFMGVSALRGLRHANHSAMHDWIKTFDADLGIVLTDTYGTDAFFEDFGLKYSKTFDGVRHDSGDPIEFADKVIEHYKKLGIDPTSKSIVFSDGLDIKTVESIACHCVGRIKFSFGIGTNFSNDYKSSDWHADGEKSEPLSIVIKLRTCAGVPVVKLSDNPEKATGDPDAVRVAEWTFNNKALDTQ